MKILVIIPARGGSKGITHKNIKPLNGKPLIHYTIDEAREIVSDEDICVSTDDPEIIKCVEDYGLKVPFVRPKELATDTAGTYEVLLHALNFYEKQGRHYDVVLLLQNTSPFRKADQIKEARSFGDLSENSEYDEALLPEYDSLKEVLRTPLPAPAAGAFVRSEGGAFHWHGNRESS